MKVPFMLYDMQAPRLLSINVLTNA